MTFPTHDQSIDQISWALEPGTEEELVMLQELGRSDTEKWIAMARDWTGGQAAAG